MRNKTQATKWSDVPTNWSWFMSQKTQENTWYFTPKQLQIMKDAWYTEQSLMNEIVKVWQKQWVDWNKLLNQANSALSWDVLPSFVSWESENANKMLENDRSGFVEPDDAITWMINNVFPNLWTQLNKWYENTFNVWQDIEWMLKEEMMKYQSAYWPWGTMRKMLDEEIASQQQRLGQEKDLMNVQYWLTNAGIDTNAIESWASSWQVAASKAAANKQSLLQQAEYNDRLAKFGTDKLKSYQDMEDKLSTYMQDYIAKYGNSKDKYVIDNFNNLVNLQSNLAIQVKNLEAQNKALAADAANTAALANAMWGQATWSWSNTTVPTWAWAVDQLPDWYYDWLTQWGQTNTATVSNTDNVWIPYAPQSLQPDWSYVPNMSSPNSWTVYWQTDTPDRSYREELRRMENKLKFEIGWLQSQIASAKKTVSTYEKQLPITAKYYGWNYQKNPVYLKQVQTLNAARENLKRLNEKMSWLSAQAKSLWISQ